MGCCNVRGPHVFAPSLHLKRVAAKYAALGKFVRKFCETNNCCFPSVRIYNAKLFARLKKITHIHTSLKHCIMIYNVNYVFLTAGALVDKTP